MNKYIIHFRFLFVVMFLSTAIAQEIPPYQAIITDIKGSVLIKRETKQEYVNAIWGNQLFSGDILKTLERSYVSLLFINNNLITLGANSLLTIAKNNLPTTHSNSSSLDLSKEFPKNESLLSFRNKENGEVGVLAGLRSTGSDEIILMSPRNSKILDLKPEFRWQSYKEFENYKVTLFDNRGKLWTKDAKGSSYEMSKDDEKLNFGYSYFWYVEGQDLFVSKRSESIGFSLPNKDEHISVKKQAESILKKFNNDPNSSSYQFILGKYLEREGFYLDAITSFRFISQLNKNAPLPHEILGNLYQKIGLKDMAISELQKAVDLSGESE